MNNSLPPKIHNAYWFAVFNTISWQICIGNTLVLFANHLGASSTTIAMLAGLPPLMTIVQLPVSQYVEDYGCKKMMLHGWSLRVAILLFLSILPILGKFLPSTTLVNLLLVAIFFFSLFRATAQSAWFPWVTAIIPEESRGHFLGKIQNFAIFAAIFSLLLSGSILGNQPGALNYSGIFLISFLGGIISLYFLNRIPEVSPSQSISPPSSKTSWGEIFQNSTFIKLLAFNALIQFVFFSDGLYVTLFLKKEMGMNDGYILWMTAGAAIMGIMALNIFSPRIDRMGSKPVLGLILLWWTLYSTLWFMVCTGLLNHTKGFAMGLYVLNGFFGILFELSATRLLLNTVGKNPGNARYFALYSVIICLIMGSIPIPWGMFFDSMKNTSFSMVNMQWNAYSVYFAFKWIAIPFIAVLLFRLKEVQSESPTYVIYQIFVGMPSRTLSALLQRFR